MIQKTFVIIKPDGIKRNLIGEVISRFERVSLKIVALKLIKPNKDMFRGHYTLDKNWIRIVGEKSLKAAEEKGYKLASDNPIELGNIILDKLTNYMTEGPVIAMILEGYNSVAIVRKLVGGTEPLTSAVGTIRGDYVNDSYNIADMENRSVRNIVHASGSVDEAMDEIKHWFSENEIYS